MLKNKTSVNLIIGLLFNAILFWGSVSFAGQKHETDATLKKVSKEVREAVNSLKNYSVNKRDDAYKKVSTVIEDIDSRIERLEDRVESKWDQLDQSAREKTRKTLKTMRKGRNDLSEWYGGMQHSSSQAWQHVKDGFIKSYEALANAYDNAAEEF